MKKLTATLLASVFASVLAAAEPGEIVPNENLVVEGIPKIPAAIADVVRPYTETRGAGLSDWHPTKREILISTRFGDTNQVHAVKMPGGDRRQLTFFPDRVAGARYEPTKGDFFIFSKDVGGGEFFQKYRYDVATGEERLRIDRRASDLHFTDGGKTLTAAVSGASRRW